MMPVMTASNHYDFTRFVTLYLFLSPRPLCLQPDSCLSLIIFGLYPNGPPTAVLLVILLLSCVDFVTYYRGTSGIRRAPLAQLGYGLMQTNTSPSTSQSDNRMLFSLIDLT